MGQSYVVNGAKVSCTMGTVDVPLRTTPGRRVKLKGKDRANIMDCIPYVNVGPFGVCKTTHLPCTPACAVGGMPALLNKSMAVCPVGAGMLKIKDDGQ